MYYMIYNTNLHFCIPIDSHLAIWDGTGIRLICRNKYIFTFEAKFLKHKDLKWVFHIAKLEKPESWVCGWASFYMPFIARSRNFFIYKMDNNSVILIRIPWGLNELLLQCALNSTWDTVSISECWLWCHMLSRNGLCYPPSAGPREELLRLLSNLHHSPNQSQHTN